MSLVVAGSKSPKGQVMMGGAASPAHPSAMLGEVPQIWAMKEAAFQSR